MSGTLNLFDALLARASHYHQQGASHEALRVLRRLTSLRELPAEVAEQAQKMLGEIRLKARKFARARRHLAVALAYQPKRADYHFLMGEAVYAEQRGDLRAALRHFRRCVILEPQNARYLCEYGLVAIEVGKPRLGLKMLRKAKALALDDFATVAKVVEGLRLLERHQEARQTILEARFRSPRDPRFVRLWNDDQFQKLHTGQSRRRQRIAGKVARNAGPVLLPFIRSTEVEGKVIRFDDAHTVQPPHTPEPTHTPRGA